VGSEVRGDGDGDGEIRAGVGGQEKVWCDRTISLAGVAWIWGVVMALVSRFISWFVCTVPDRSALAKYTSIMDNSL